MIRLLILWSLRGSFFHPFWNRQDVVAEGTQAHHCFFSRRYVAVDPAAFRSTVPWMGTAQKRTAAMPASAAGSSRTAGRGVDSCDVLLCLCGMLVEHAVDRRPGCVVIPGQLAQALPPLPVTDDGRSIKFQ